MRLRVDSLSVLAAVLTIAGALNWGVVGLLDFNVVRAVGRRSGFFGRIVYGLVGLAGLWLVVALAVPTLLAKMGRKEDGSTVLPGERAIVGKEFPHLRGTTLEGRTMMLPEDIRGKVALVAVGFAYESRWDVEIWVEAFRHRFEDRPGFTCYEVPVISGLSRLAAPIIEGGMRRGTPADLHGRVLTVYGPDEPIRSRLGATHTADTWVYLLDANGRVIFQVGGAFDEEQFESLASKASAAEAATRRLMERRAA